MKSLDKKERVDIFQLFLNSHRLKFSEIEQSLGIRSNMVSYHIEQMVKDGLLEKKGSYYLLAKDAEKFIPLFSGLSGMEIGPVPVILVAVMHGTKILLIKRNKRPYKDYWSMIGGKIALHENYVDASIRKIREKTGLDVEFISLNDIMHEHVEDSGTVKHSFILIFTKVKSMGMEFKETDAGELRWFDIKKLPEKIIPSDMLLIKNSIRKKFKLPQIRMFEKDGIIESYKEK